MIALARLSFVSVSWVASPVSPMAALSAQTQQLVKFAQPLLVSSHVRVVDGHGTPAREDQSAVLRDG